MLNDPSFQAALYRLSPFGFGIYDLAGLGQLELISGPIADRLGYTVQEYLAASKGGLGPLVHPEDRIMTSQMIQYMRTMSDSEVVERELRLRAKSGEVIWVLTRVVVYDRNKEGTVTKLLGAMGEITALKSLEKQLDEQTRRLNLIKMKDASQIRQEVSAIVELAEAFRASETSPLRQRKLIGYLRTTVLSLKERAHELAQVSEPTQPPDDTSLKG